MTNIVPIGGACVWHGSDMARSGAMAATLVAAQLAEIDAALGRRGPAASPGRR